jgi:protein-histidine pros-kinase
VPRGASRPRDTLALRLFVLMWGALAASHALAWFVTTKWALPPPGVHDSADAVTAAGLAEARPPPPREAAPRPPPASWAPGPWEPAAGDGRGLPPPPRHAGAEARGPAGPPGPPGGGGTPPVPRFPSLPPDLPWPAALVDYGLRLLVLGLAAAWGARWLARPIRRLVGAAETLSPALQRGEPVARLDETRGTAEVRAAAAVFNGMARQLQQQFESRTLMVAALSHDLRTPITRLRMRLETAGAAPALVDRCAADLREMAELIDSVLAVFRPADGDPAAPAPRTDAAALALALVDDLAEAGAAVRFDDTPSGAACIVRGEALLLRRVLGNLVHNALRYAGTAEVAVRREGGEVCIVVADRGPGIPEGSLDEVQRPFARLEGSRSRDTGGVGLGLFIAREGAARLGGRLRLARRDGGGLLAELRCPAA